MGAIGLGCMRLSTAPDRDDERAIAVVHAALDAGVTFLDTADAYCHDEADTGHNERVIARALAQWGGDRASVIVGTKGGLRRPAGAWVSDARARHLRAACDASRRALGVHVIDLYQLHAVDPRTPLETSVRALAALQRDGLIRQIGLCNVNVEQIERARSIADIASVQVSLSPFDRAASRSGVVEYCRAHGLQLYAYRPLGGERRRSLVRHAALTAIAEAHAATPEQIVLAWLASAGVVPLAGATTVEHAQATGRAQHIALGVEEIAALDTLFSAQDLRPGARAQRPPLEAPGEVVLVMGMPGAGKSTLAAGFTAQGYQRLNRDARGGSLATLAGALDEGLRSGHRTWVLDNTYASRASRREVIETAWRHGVPVRCIHLVTSVADAQINAVSRLLDAHGRLPMPEELRALGRRDPRYLGPDALFRYERALEKPSLDEGFSRIEERPFAREAPDDAGPRALILDLDDLVPGAREARSFEDVARLELPASHRHATAAARADGMLIFAIAWRPQPGADALFNALAERVVVLLGFEVTCGVCPHPAGPPICWCRKPIPGLVLEFAARHAVSLRRSLVVGRSSADRTMATRLGIAFQDASTFFRDEP